MYSYKILKTDMKKTAYNGQEYLKKIYSGLSYYIKSAPVLGNLRLMILALVCGCQESLINENAIDVKSVQIVFEDLPIKTLDIFMFEDGEMTTLDSYQRIDAPHEWEVLTASRKGSSRTFILANGHCQKEDWMAVNSYESLKGLRSNLEHESHAFPVMSAEYRFCADGKQKIWMELKSLCSEVELRSVSCDFGGKSYEEEGITEMKAYLVNVNAQSMLMRGDVVMPERIINMGCLNDDDMAMMKEPELLFRKIGHLSSGNSLQTRFGFRCYPNNSPEESPGSPFTRLVIEGKIGEHIYYWPINVGRNYEQYNNGVSGNTRYIYDVTITGKGSDSPDIPVSSKVIGLKMEVLTWKEKDEYIICY